LPLSTGTLHISGRVDRIDAVANNHYIVTDYKTGATGSGFQMAVYAWLWLAAHPGTAELLYATPSPRDYEAVHLGDETNPAVVDRPYLERFLVEALADSVATARSGEFPSLAHTRDHSRYCQVCADVVQDDGSRSSSTRGDRARALVRTTTTMEA
jgi:RecB family exonuclease